MPGVRQTRLKEEKRLEMCVIRKVARQGKKRHSGRARDRDAMRRAVKWFANFGRVRSIKGWGLAVASGVYGVLVEVRYGVVLCQAACKPP